MRARGQTGRVLRRLAPGVTPSYNARVIQIYGRKKSKETRKAERFFSDRRIPYQSVDLDVKAPGRRELELFAEVLGAENLIDTQSKRYRERGLAYMEYDPLEEIADDPSLLRAPIVREGREVGMGADEGFWKTLAEKNKP